MYCNQRSQYIRPNSKKNSFRGNYSRKYGIQNLLNRCIHEFCESHFWRVFWRSAQTVYRRRRLRLYGSTSGDRCDGFTHTGGRHWRPRTSSVTRPRRYTHTLGRAYALASALLHMKSSLSNWRIWKKRANFEKKFSLLLNYYMTKSLIRKRPSEPSLNWITMYWATIQ